MKHLAFLVLCLTAAAIQAAPPACSSAEHRQFDFWVGDWQVHRPDGSSLYPVEIRYAFPAELDLMAELAGLRLEHRWSDWNRAPFTDASTGHVSVWTKPA